MKNRFIYIILSIMVVLLVMPFLRPLGLVGHFFATMTVAMMPLSCAIVLAVKGKKAIVIYLVAIPFVIIDGLSFFLTNRPLLIVELSLASFLSFYIVYLMVRHLLSIRVVTADMVYCAISTYLLIGIGWSGIFNILEIVAPGSFSAESAGDFLYFSFVTLTTVGFGDLLPLSVLAKRLVILEASMGSIYMAVIVAMIVGRYMSMQSEPGDDRETSEKITSL